MKARQIKIKQCDRCEKEIKQGDPRAYFNYYTKYDLQNRKQYLQTRLEFCPECWEKVKEALYSY